MKKILFVVLLSLTAISLVSAQSAGTGITVFVPESLLTGANGSVSIETSLATQLGLGNFLAIPFGITYMKAHGLTAGGSGYEDEDDIWYVADSLMLHAGLQARLDLGPVFATASAEGIVNWLLTHDPLIQNIQPAFNSGSADAAFIDGFSDDYSLGFGWQAGGSLGFKVGQIEVDLSAYWRTIRHSGTMDFTLWEITGASASSSAASENVDIFLNGLSIGIGGSYSF